MQASPDNSQVYLFGGLAATGPANDVYAMSVPGFADATTAEMVNLAQGKLAFIIANDATYGQRGAAAAVDGYLGTKFVPTAAATYSLTCGCNQCTLTPTNPTTSPFYTTGITQPWWGVDLGAAAQVDFIHLYMRANNVNNGNDNWPQGQSVGFQIYASFGNTTGSACVPGALSCPYTSTVGGCPAGTVATPSGCLVQNTPSDAPMGGPTVISTPGLVARYLWIVLPGSNRILSLCEFQAWQKKPFVWRKLSGNYNAAQGQIASQSSTLPGFGQGLASRAVDGLVTNKLDNAQPFTVSSTCDGGCGTPYSWWQVDMGRSVDVSLITVYARNDCCTNRNVGMTFYIGDSADFSSNTMCTSAVKDITPPAITTTPPANTGCYTFPSTVYPAGFPYFATPVVTTPLAVQTACFVYFKCTGKPTTRGRYLQIVKQPGDGNAIMLGEVQVTANRLLDLPSPRSGMSSTTFGGNLVIFGGMDAGGFSNNEIRFFDMLRGQWAPPFSPLGTTPTGRAYAALALAPQQVFGLPSNSLVLFGGTSNAAVVNDVNVLSFPQCPAIDQTGVSVAKCSQGGTVCYFSCFSFAQATNSGPVVCQLDGTWSGTLPVCRTAAPAAPTGVSAVVNPSTGAVTVTWNPLPPSSFGYSTQLLQYEVNAYSGLVYEDFAVGKYPDASQWSVAPTYLSLSAKTPITLANNFDFFVSAYTGLPMLRVAADTVANCGFGIAGTVTVNGYVMTPDFGACALSLRRFPASVDVTGSWSIETQIYLGSTATPPTINGMGLIGIYDTTKNAGAGMLPFYAGHRYDGFPYSPGMETLDQAFQQFQCVATLCAQDNAYYRITRDVSMSQTDATWSAYVRYSVNDPWQLIGSVLDSRMPGGPISTAGLRIALGTRNWAGTLREDSLFSFLRISELTNNDPGTYRYVDAAYTSAIIYGLSQGGTYRFTVTAQTASGWGQASAPFGIVSIPRPNVAPPASSSIPVNIAPSSACSMSSLYSSAYPCTNAIDGLLNNFAHTNAGVVAGVDPGGSWYTLDLGYVANISYIQVYHRLDCCTARSDGSLLYVGMTGGANYASSPTCPGGPYTFSTVTLAMATAAGVAPPSPYSLRIPCPLQGRYVTMWTVPNQPNNLNEIMVFTTTPNPNAANALSLVSQGKSCSMSSFYGGATPTYPCGNALDGNLGNFAHSNTPSSVDLAVNGPWFQIDLGYAMTISAINIFDRIDCCQNRLDGGSILVGNNAGGDWAKNRECPGSPFVLSTITAAQAAAQGLPQAYARQLPCQLTGRFVIFRIPYNTANPINLGELQVFAKTCPARLSTGASPIPGSGCAPSCGAVGGLAAENGQVVLSAPTGCVITTVVFASFGTPSSTNPSLATPYSYGTCNAANSATVVSQACVGVQGCVIQANIATFGKFREPKWLSYRKPKPPLTALSQSHLVPNPEQATHASERSRASQSRSSRPRPRSAPARCARCSAARATCRSRARRQRRARAARGATRRSCVCPCAMTSSRRPTRRTACRRSTRTTSTSPARSASCAA
jgi:hypothetical protein